MAQRTDTYAYGSLSEAGGINLTRALLAGLLGTVAITVLMYGGSVMGFPRMDIATMLGTMFTGDPATAFGSGLALHLMIGLVLALGYAVVFARLLPGQGWQRGALYGLVPWLMAMLVVMPMMALVHPMVQTGMMPAPGVFLAGMGTVMAPLGSLIGHLVYGALVGAVYGLPDADQAA